MNSISLDGIAICVVDDSQAFLSGLKGLLDAKGCVVHTFLDPVEALRKLPTLEVDIVITDLEMPGMSGLEFITSFRTSAANSQIPLLLLTGDDNPEILAHAIVLGADGFVSKSNLRTVLFAQLLALVRTRNLYKQLVKVKQFSAIKALIGTYKHEFGNTLAILFGRTSALERQVPEISNQKSFESMKDCHLRLKTTLRKLDDLTAYEEQGYAGTAKIVKL